MILEKKIEDSIKHHEEQYKRYKNIYGNKKCPDSVILSDIYQYHDFYEMIKQIEKEECILENFKNNINHIYSGLKEAATIVTPLNSILFFNDVSLIKTIYNNYLKKN